MKKVLLVYDDYNQLTLTETYLKKIGFDTVGVSNESKINDQLLSFNPDIVIANGQTKQVTSQSVGQKLKENHKFHGKVILVLPKDLKLSPGEMIKLKMDSTLSLPVDPVKLVTAVSKLSDLDANLMVEKLKKAQFGDPKIVELMRASFSSITAPEKSQAGKYDQFIDKTIDTKSTTLQRTKVKDKLADMKKDWNIKYLQQIDDLKRQFANALFKKDKR